RLQPDGGNHGAGEQYGLWRRPPDQRGGEDTVEGGDGAGDVGSIYVRSAIGGGGESGGGAGAGGASRPAGRAGRGRSGYQVGKRSDAEPVRVHQSDGDLRFYEQRRDDVWEQRLPSSAAAGRYGARRRVAIPHENAEHEIGDELCVAEGKFGPDPDGQG